MLLRWWCAAPWTCWRDPVSAYNTAQSARIRLSSLLTCHVSDKQLTAPLFLQILQRRLVPLGRLVYFFPTLYLSIIAFFMGMGKTYVLGLKLDHHKDMYMRHPSSTPC